MSTNKKAKPEIKKHSFQAEVQQLLHLMIHSLYSNKEIFIRELISNASDACDKLRFQSLTNESLLEEDEQPLGIWVTLDEKKGTISIRDNGIGMAEDEVIRDIGTIARSGTKAFLQQMSKDESADNNFIGQFGVGFYSSFLVGKQVTLLTRKAGAAKNKGVKWVSDGSGEYTLEQADRPQKGTEIIISLNKGDKEYADTFRVKSVISKYSDHIFLPIHMIKPPLDDQDKKDKSAEPEWETINTGSALWARPKKEISVTEYNDFYTSLTYDQEPPAVVLHNRVEGKIEYISLFYVPSKAPYDLWDREQRNGIKLYVRRVFISDDAKTIMPNYLRFVRGLIDSSDLPLNVSREFLQQNRQIEKIKSASVKKILSELTKLATKDAEKYNNLWKEYGKVLKEGIVEDFENKQTIAELIRFSTTHNDEQEQKISLNDYVTRMPEKQNAIYYITAESYNAAQSSPHLEVFRKNNIEVLLLSDPVDEWMIGHLSESNGKSFKSIAKGDLDIDSLKGKNSNKKVSQKKTQPLIEKLKSILEEQVKDVRVSDRLVDSPSCLVADTNDLGGNMERILQAIGKDAPVAKPILEINADHSLVTQINPESDDIENWARLLFEQAVLAEGGMLKNPGDFVKRMNMFLTK